MDPESRSVDSRSGGQPVPVCVVPYTNSESEISLVDLWRIIAARKYLVLMSVLVAVALATVYVFVAEPSYRAEANLLPPQQQDIQALAVNINGSSDLGVERYTPELVYQAFLKNLRSKGLRREFFDANDLVMHYLNDASDKDANIDRVFDRKFNVNLQVQEDKADPSLAVVSLSDTDPQLASQWLNQLVEFADKRTVRQLVNDVNSAIRSEIDGIQRQMDSKLKLAAQRRFDRINQLREALRIAKETAATGASVSPVVPGKKQPNIVVSTGQMPLYMRGEEALKAEISVLESRKSDEPFIPALRNLQERKAFLDGALIDAGQLSSITIDMAARVPYKAEKPRKSFVFLLASVLGLMFGIFAAMISEVFNHSRQ
ncbi:chain length determinant protein (polysaccharide antigen chain regulator) [Thiogranum longum]|uniref:Chain length determinant protein (Polysaccharide antigen chain regulator) n=1 Tax=Thiogranum longum TaxID=1537524 RepID=A0A4R1H9V9_9GAMM|nr:Wzz/FepE/Etk N-terminal domain-containing protein [Thiogranum longum]TCK18098.1 chain length determinant protein (polysaccharide antigen chain regulator) [Thiogranum longum]